MSVTYYVSLSLCVPSRTGFPMRVRPRRPMTRKTLPTVHMEPGACPRAKAILLLARLYNLPLTDALTTTYSRCLYLRLMSISARWSGLGQEDEEKYNELENIYFFFFYELLIFEDFSTVARFSNLFVRRSLNKCDIFFFLFYLIRYRFLIVGALSSKLIIYARFLCTYVRIENLRRSINFY